MSSPFECCCRGGDFAIGTVRILDKEEISALQHGMLALISLYGGCFLWVGVWNLMTIKLYTESGDAATDGQHTRLRHARRRRLQAARRGWHESQFPHPSAAF